MQLEILGFLHIESRKPTVPTTEESKTAAQRALLAPRALKAIALHICIWTIDSFLVSLPRPSLAYSVLCWFALRFNLMFWNLLFQSHFWFDDPYIWPVLWHLLFFLQVWIPPVLSLISLDCFHDFPFEPRPSSVSCFGHIPSSAYRDFLAPGDYCCHYLAPSAGGPNSGCPKWVNLGPEKAIQIPLPISQVFFQYSLATWCLLNDGNSRHLHYPTAGKPGL